MFKKMAAAASVLKGLDGSENKEWRTREDSNL